MRKSHGLSPSGRGAQANAGEIFSHGQPSGQQFERGLFLGQKPVPVNSGKLTDSFVFIYIFIPTGRNAVIIVDQDMIAQIDLAKREIMNIKTAIESYLNILNSNEGEEADRIEKLTVSLDELALAAHKVSFTSDDRDYPDPPEYDSVTVRKTIGKLFPSLGLYNVALDVSTEIAQTSLAIGDAIDDIADIARDLTDVLWRYDNTSEDDALFHFQVLYRGHWGLHLRNLQLYLHDRYW